MPGSERSGTVFHDHANFIKKRDRVVDGDHRGSISGFEKDFAAGVDVLFRISLLFHQHTGERLSVSFVMGVVNGAAGDKVDALAENEVMPFFFFQFLVKPSDNLKTIKKKMLSRKHENMKKDTHNFKPLKFRVFVMALNCFAFIKHDFSLRC